MQKKEGKIHKKGWLCSEVASNRQQKKAQRPHHNFQVEPYLIEMETTPTLFASDCYWLEFEFRSLDRIWILRFDNRKMIFVLLSYIGYINGNSITMWHQSRWHSNCDSLWIKYDFVIWNRQVCHHSKRFLFSKLNICWWWRVL